MIIKSICVILGVVDSFFKVDGEKYDKEIRNCLEYFRCYLFVWICKYSYVNVKKRIVEISIEE